MNLCKGNFEQTDTDQFKNDYLSYKIWYSIYGGDSFTEQAQRYLSNKTIVVNELKVEVSSILLQNIESRTLKLQHFSRIREINSFATMAHL